MGLKGKAVVQRGEGRAADLAIVSQALGGQLLKRQLAGNMQGLSWWMRQLPQDQAQPATAGHNRGPAHRSLHPNSDNSWASMLYSSWLQSAAEVSVRSVKPSFKGAKPTWALHSTVSVSGSGL